MTPITVTVDTGLGGTAVTDLVQAKAGDIVTSAAPGESIFFNAVPNEGFYLDHVGVFNPDNAIDVSKIQLFEHGDDLYELVMIDHDIIMTCYFTPIA